VRCKPTTHEAPEVDVTVTICAARESVTVVAELLAAL
jgi:hypothetical protein